MTSVVCVVGIVTGILNLLSSGVQAGRDICTTYGNGVYKYCDDGYYCCDNNTRCCRETLTTGTVIGIVFGVIFIVAVCVMCSFVFAKKKKLRPGQLVTPRNTVVVSTVNQPQVYPNGNPPGYGQPYPYGPQHQPPTGFPQPPPYAQVADPAFPPPPEYKLREDS